MTKKEQLYLFVDKNPGLTSGEISEGLGFDISYVKTTLGRLENQGLVDNDEDRKYFVIGEYPNSRGVYVDKREYYQRLLDMYMEILEEAQTVEDKMRVGREARLIIERL